MKSQRPYRPEEEATLVSIHTASIVFLLAMVASTAMISIFADMFTINPVLEHVQGYGEKAVQNTSEMGNAMLNRLAATVMTSVADYVETNLHATVHPPEVTIRALQEVLAVEGANFLHKNWMEREVRSRIVREFNRLAYSGCVNTEVVLLTGEKGPQLMSYTEHTLTHSLPRNDFHWRYLSKANGSEVDRGEPGATKMIYTLDKAWEIIPGPCHASEYYTHSGNVPMGICRSKPFTVWDQNLVETLQDEPLKTTWHSLREYHGYLTTAVSSSFDSPTPDVRIHLPPDEEIVRRPYECIKAHDKFESLPVGPLLQNMDMADEGGGSEEECASLCCGIISCTHWQWCSPEGEHGCGCYIGRGEVNRERTASPGKLVGGFRMTDTKLLEYLNTTHVPENTSRLGVVQVFLNAEEITQVLKMVKVPAGSRLYITEGDILVATSHGNPAHTMRRKAVIPVDVGTEEFINFRIKVGECDEQLVREHFEYTRSNPGLLSYDKPRLWTAGGGEKYLVLGRYIQRESAPVWSLRILIPREQIFGSVDSQKRVAFERINRVNEAAVEQAQNRHIQLIIVATVMCLFMIIVSVVLSRQITKPLLRLAEQMEDVSRLNLEFKEASPSCLTLREVRALQSIFSDMVEKLREYRSYLPGAVLQQAPSLYAAVACPPHSQKLDAHEEIAQIVHTRAAAILYIKIPDLARLFEDNGIDDCQRRSHDFFHLIFETAKEFRGVIHSFDLGQVTVSFGAATEMELPAQAACECALKLRPGLEAVTSEINKSCRTNLSPRCVVAWDVLRAGCLGNQQHQSFTLMSGILDTIQSLVDACVKNDCSIICTEPVYDRVQHIFDFNVLSAVDTLNCPLYKLHNVRGTFQAN
eukprot:Sspe_Gene.5493::Locus_1817_Transcript_3_5_Confidence_0.250_Length_2836::g.5493::m.5493